MDKSIEERCDANWPTKLEDLQITRDMMAMDREEFGKAPLFFPREDNRGKVNYVPSPWLFTMIQFFHSQRNWEKESVIERLLTIIEEMNGKEYLEFSEIEVENEKIRAFTKEVLGFIYDECRKHIL